MSQTSPPPDQPLPLRFHNPPLHPAGRPPASSLVSLAVVAAGYLLALVGPSLVVAPTASSAPAGRLATAFGLTALGVAVAVVAAGLAYRRTRNWSWLVIASIPAVALIAGGAILTATKAG
jgi:hypothetical protein